jgi:hypothetical protein
LDEANAGEALCLGPLEHGVHEQPAGTAVLHGRVDGDRSQARDGGALVEKVRADHAAVALRDHSMDTRRAHEEGDRGDARLETWEVAREAVALGDGSEGLVDDAPELGRVLGAGLAQGYGVHGCDHAYSMPREVAFAIRSIPGIPPDLS